MQLCPQCNGQGEVRLTESNTKNLVICPECDGRKEIENVEFEAWQARKELWCQCGEDSTFGDYPGDGECQCGIVKHHVHCGTCSKVSQIG